MYRFLWVNCDCYFEHSYLSCMLLHYRYFYSLKLKNLPVTNSTWPIPGRVSSTNHKPVSGRVEGGAYVGWVRFRFMMSRAKPDSLPSYLALLYAIMHCVYTCIILVFKLFYYSVMVSWKWCEQPWIVLLLLFPTLAYWRRNLVWRGEITRNSFF